MLLRAFAFGLGLAELLWPRQTVDFWTRLATKGEAEPRRWVYTAARLEGVCLVLWAVTRGRVEGSTAGSDEPMGAGDGRRGSGLTASAGDEARRVRFDGRTTFGRSNAGFVTLFTGGTKVRI